MFIKNPGEMRVVGGKLSPDPRALPESGGFIGRGPGNVNLDVTSGTERLAAAGMTSPALSRRRSTEEGIRRASRYLATVRRAMFTPSAVSSATMRSSDRISRGSSFSIISRMRSRTASALCDSAPFIDWIEAVKKYFSSNNPRGVEIYLLEVTRLTVDSCIEIASAMMRRLSGRRWRTPWVRNASWWRTISLATFRMVRARWSRLLTSQLAVLRQSAR